MPLEAGEILKNQKKNSKDLKIQNFIKKLSKFLILKI